MQNAYQVKHSDFSDRVDIVCPKCAGKALVKAGEPHEGQASKSARCVCTHCGYHSDLQAGGFRLTLWGGEVDPYFHHPLWYMAPCLEGTVWAYNLPHLELIEHFVAATDRGRSGLPNKNSSIAARLPRWMSAAKNRAAV